jgi:hypothetical protein
MRLTPRVVPAAYWESQRLTAPETFAAVIANKLLKLIADFVPKADNPSIRMVNGELMAERTETRL